MCLERQAGFSIIAAIFLLVVLALLAAFIASVTGMQQSSGQLEMRNLDIDGSREMLREYQKSGLLPEGSVLLDLEVDEP